MATAVTQNNKTEKEPPTDQVRVILWTTPRSVSTAFFRAIASNVRIKPIFEPFCIAASFGEDSRDVHYKDQQQVEGYSFKQVKELYEASHTGFSAVFAKDMPYAIKHKLDDSSFLPHGYIHTFLIRTPEKTAVSQFKMSINSEQCGGWNTFHKEDIEMASLYKLFHYVTQKLEQPPILLDADDLIANPEFYLRAYCEKTGLQYIPEMLEWNTSSFDLNTVLPSQWLGWYQKALATSSFVTSKPADDGLEDRSNTQSKITLPREVQAAIDENMPLYRELYQYRLLKPERQHMEE